jgi:hypothetical protein
VNDRNFVHGTSKQKDAQTRIREIVTSESFIAYLKKCLLILEPIDEMITMFQSDSAALSDVFMRFDLLDPTFVALEGLHYTEKSYLFKLSKQRFEFLYVTPMGSLIYWILATLEMACHCHFARTLRTRFLLII